MNNDDPNDGIKDVFVGSMYIEGTGVHETSEVHALAESDLKINVGFQGTDLIFSCYYYMNCPGLLDYGSVKLSVEGAPDDEADTYDFAEGHLFATIYNCKVGDVISWVLTVIYDDALFPYPLTDIGYGYGLCTLSRTILRDIISLFRPITTLRGRIICR